MLLCLCFLLVGHTFADIHVETVLQGSEATLPCPQKKGKVAWTRLINGEKVTLLTIENGSATADDARFSSLADNSLVIANVEPFDSAKYWCDGREVYLNVTTGAPTVGPDGGPGPGPAAGDAAGAETQRPSDLWKLPVGVAAGAASVLLAVLTLRLCSKRRAATDANSDKAAPEVIYEEIEAGEERPRGEAAAGGPYYWTSFTETASASTPPKKSLGTAGRSSGECVYHLAQSPAQAGRVGC